MSIVLNGTTGITTVAMTATDNIAGQLLLDISSANAGRIKFPATQNPSADANTLDDYREGTFVGTGTGFTASPTATFSYVKVGNMVTVKLSGAELSGTSNATTFTITGFPAIISPSATATLTGLMVIDSGTYSNGSRVDLNNSGVMTLYKTAPTGTWTNTGSKGLSFCCFTYSVS